MNKKAEEVYNNMKIGAQEEKATGIISAKVLDGFNLEILFDNNVIKVCDLSSFIQFIPMFESLKDKDLFNNFTIDEDGKGITWGTGANFYYKELWDNGAEIQVSKFANKEITKIAMPRIKSFPKGRYDAFVKPSGDVQCFGRQEHGAWGNEKNPPHFHVEIIQDNVEAIFSIEPIAFLKDVGVNPMKQQDIHKVIEIAETIKNEIIQTWDESCSGITYEEWQVNK